MHIPVQVQLVGSRLVGGRWSVVGWSVGRWSVVLRKPRSKAILLENVIPRSHRTI